MSINRALSLTDDPSKVLGLKVGPHQEIKPGQYIGRADAQTSPELSLPTASPNTTYLAINIDIDAPFPSVPVLGPILHWIQPGLRADVASGTLKTTAPFVANYIGPAPPPGSAPHRYVFLLYEQPEGFEGAEYAPADGKELSNWYRIRYDLESWEKAVGLGEVVGVNYFVSN